MKIENPMTEIFVCECHSFEHQTKFIYDTETNSLFAYVHLSQHGGFLRRLAKGLAYAFGYSYRFGEWDEFLFQAKDQEELRKFLNQIKQKEDGDPIP